MKYGITIKTILLASVLAACGDSGGGGGTPEEKKKKNSASGKTECGTIKAGSKVLRKARGYFDDNKSFIELTIYGDGDGRIGATGKLEVRDVEELFAYSNSYYGYGYGYEDDDNKSSSKRRTGSVKTCIKSDGESGYIEEGVIMPGIQIELKGEKVTVELGGGYSPAYLSENEIAGDVYLDFGGDTADYFPVMWIPTND